MDHESGITFLQTPERALAKVAMIGWAVGCDPYPKPEDLMYYRAVMEGMERCEVDGEKNDPKEFFGAATYAYLMHWHTKRMSSARAEYSGVKNIRGVFNATHHFTPDMCRTDEALEELLAKGRELVKGERSKASDPYRCAPVLHSISNCTEASVSLEMLR